MPFHSNLVWPPFWAVIIFVFVYATLEAGMWLIHYSYGGSSPSDFEEIGRIRGLVLFGTAVGYAIYRIWRFHPACNPAYAAWLMLSPWTAAKPLPLGPIHPVWQDGIVLAALASLGYWHASIEPMMLLLAFGLAYLIGMTLLLAITRRWRSCLVLGFLWPALLLPKIRGLPEQAALMAAVILFIWHGHRESLRAFPWGYSTGLRQPLSPQPRSLMQVQIELQIPGLSNPALDTSSKAMGWPYVALAPKVQHPAVSNVVSLCLALLFGWWTFCLCAFFQETVPPVLVLAVFIGAAGIRLLIYCLTVTPPFNVWGRLAFGRLVVPGFDRVFLTPLTVIVLGMVGGALLPRDGAWANRSTGLLVAVLWFVLLAGGPTLQNWFLTGHHRWRPPRILNAKQGIRPV
jgi:hypothetical protein